MKIKSLKFVFLCFFIHLNSCSSYHNPFDSNPLLSAHVNYKKTRNKKSVLGDDLIVWLNQTNKSGPFSQVPYIVAHELKINSDQERREKLVKSYKKIYDKLIKNKYGKKFKSVIYSDGSENVYQERTINVKNEYKALYLSVFDYTLKLAEEGKIEFKGESELREVVNFIKNYP